MLHQVKITLPNHQNRPFNKKKRRNKNISSKIRKKKQNFRIYDKKKLWKKMGILGYKGIFYMLV